MRAQPFIAIALFAFFTACASGPAVKSQAYAKLKEERTLEYEFPVVWKGIESALKNYKILDRDPEDVGELEMRTLKRRELETDWVYGQSRDKYIEYKVNGSPRKKMLQTRIKFKILAETVIGGVQVSVRSQEEIERLNEDGSSQGFESAANRDTSRTAEMIEKIQQAIDARIP